MVTLMYQLVDRAQKLYHQARSSSASKVKEIRYMDSAIEDLRIVHMILRDGGALDDAQGVEFQMASIEACSYDGMKSENPELLRAKLATIRRHIRSADSRDY